MSDWLLGAPRRSVYVICINRKMSLCSLAPSHKFVLLLPSFANHTLPVEGFLHGLPLKTVCDWCERYLFCCRSTLEDCSTNLTVEVALGLSPFRAFKSTTGSGTQCPLKWRETMLNWF